MYKTLSEAADYTGFTKPAFTHLFYNNVNGRLTEIDVEDLTAGEEL